MIYEETLQWMYGKLPMYQRQGRIAHTHTLEGSIAFSRYLNYPEQRFSTIHVAGTNGKGSTSHMLASILQEAGYTVGLYTSPHLKDFRERIRINGKIVDKAFVVAFIQEHRRFLEQYRLSFFEMTVGMAFAYFATQKVAIAVIETGLGGRLDATNIITPEISVITNIGYDHTDMLGATLQEIAQEKAGIIKPGVPVVLSEYQQETYAVFKRIAETRHSLLTIAPEDMKTYSTDLLGAYQAKNIKGVITAVKQLRKVVIEESHIKQGLLHVVKNTSLKGRWQQLASCPKVICDIAHNSDGLRVVFDQVGKEQYETLHIVLGVVKDKDLKAMFMVLPKMALYYFCSPNVPRGLAGIRLQEKAREFDIIGLVYPSVGEAYMAALEKASCNDLVYIGGSAFVVAEVV